MPTEALTHDAALSRQLIRESKHPRRNSQNSVSSRFTLDWVLYVVQTTYIIKQMKTR